MVGTALRAALVRREIDFHYTTRRGTGRIEQCYLDLLNPPVVWPSPRQYDVVYLVAAIAKFAECERDPATWVVNVDAPIALARTFNAAFKVFISSDAVEYAGNTAYARQKAHVEAYMQTIDAAIVRPNRIAPEHAGVFAEFLIEVAETRHVGVVRWKWTGAPAPAQTQGEVAYG